MSLEVLALYAAGALQFYGAWSIDFAWNARESTGKVGLPFPRGLRYVSARSWWWHAWLAMAGGVVLLFLRTAPFDSLVGQVGFVIAVTGLVFVWYPWYTGKGVLRMGYAATWNIAFFFGVAGGSVLMALGPALIAFLNSF